MTLESGTNLGPYEILSAVGAGGMGEVYRAKDTRLDREVAIKVLPAAMSQDAQFRARFEREAKTISSLSHPNICSLFDVGREGETDYLVMEYCEGETLADRLKKGPLPADQLFRTGTQIAYALDKAHRQGIIHRDLKPANVMLTRDGAKLLDFGLAKLGPTGSGINKISEHELTALATENQPLTEEGTLLGTFQYMAPEQLEGQEADGRADIFALGTVLYEMATGKPAFSGASRASLIAAILEHQPTAVSVVQPMAPPALDHVIKRCVEKDPEDRWQSAHDVARQLEWIAEGGSQIGVAAPVATRRKSRERLAWLLAAFGVVTAVGMGILMLAQPELERVVTQSFILPPDGLSFDFTEAHAGSLSLSPDGSMVAFTLAGEESTRSLWIRPLGSLEARKLSGTDGATNPFWSPDSRFLAFFADGKLKKVDVAGAPPLAICDSPNGRSGSWNKDGVIIFSPTSTTGIHRVDAAGGTPIAVTELDTEKGETTHRWAEFLPDGEHFLFMAGAHGLGTSAEYHSIYVSSLGERERKSLFQARSNVVYSLGHLLYVRDGVLIAQAFDSKGLEMTGDPRPVTSETRYAADYFRGVFSLSEDGLLVYQTGQSDRRSQLVWFDRSGNEIGTVGEPENIDNLALSPDGSRVALEIAESGSGTSDIWVYDIDRDLKSRFTFGQLVESNPVWSPDGELIAYAEIESPERGTEADIWIKPSSGGGEATLFFKSDETAMPVSFSPDGKYLTATLLDIDNDFDIKILPLEDDSDPIDFLVRDFSDSFAQFSPDGRWLSYLSNESGRDELYVVPFPEGTGRWQISTTGAFWGYWREGEIILGSDQGFVSVPYSATGAKFEIGSPKQLFNVDRATFTDITFDGQKFLILRSPEQDLGTPITLTTDWTAVLDR